jgi:hypothetical protein
MRLVADSDSSAVGLRHRSMDPTEAPCGASYAQHLRCGRTPRQVVVSSGARSTLDFGVVRVGVIVIRAEARVGMVALIGARVA